MLCFSQPRVQEFYRDLLQRFFKDFPEIETLYLFGMDSGGEGCDPGSCPRCRGMSKFEQRDRLIRFLCEEGGKSRPGLRVLTTGWHWESMPAEFLERQSKLPDASRLPSGLNATFHTVFVCPVSVSNTAPFAAFHTFTV